jgi:hypothetical protein
MLTPSPNACAGCRRAPLVVLIGLGRLLGRSVRDYVEALAGRGGRRGGRPAVPAQHAPAAGNLSDVPLAATRQCAVRGAPIRP